MSEQARREIAVMATIKEGWGGRLDDTSAPVLASECKETFSKEKIAARLPGDAEEGGCCWVSEHARRETAVMSTLTGDWYYRVDVTGGPLLAG